MPRGLSKSAVQNGMRCLLRRHLVRVQRESATAIPEYRVLRPWNRKVATEPPLARQAPETRPAIYSYRSADNGSTRVARNAGT